VTDVDSEKFEYSVEVEDEDDVLAEDVTIAAKKDTSEAVVVYTITDNTPGTIVVHVHRLWSSVSNSRSVLLGFMVVQGVNISCVCDVFSVAAEFMVYVAGGTPTMLGIGILVST
jgi:hypothetical protein